MSVYLLMKVGVDGVDYSEILNYIAFRRCSVLGAGGVYSGYALVKNLTAKSLDLDRTR